VIGVVGDVLPSLDAQLARIQTMDELLGAPPPAGNSTYSCLGRRRVALLLAAIGLYGLVSHSVSQRKAEIGIRSRTQQA